ncbi:MAG: hypothetical protein H7Z11_01035 [Verrucomicrobia bacterium]|nr:hypothetical protein [Leptolyngbya sp. ES-bin-22]
MLVAASQYTKAETFLNTCSNEEIKLTAEMYEIAPKHKKETLVNVPMTQAQLAQKMIEAEEARIMQERGTAFHTLSEWGKERFTSMDLTELRIHAKYAKVDTTYKTFRLRTIAKTRQQLIQALLYETNYSECF